MNGFFEIFERHAYRLGWNLNIYYSSITDWHLTVGYKCTHSKHGEEILCVQDSDREFVFAKAQVLLKEWMIENHEGY